MRLFAFAIFLGVSFSANAGFVKESYSAYAMRTLDTLRKIALHEGVPSQKIEQNIQFASAFVFSGPCHGVVEGDRTKAKEWGIYQPSMLIAADEDLLEDPQTRARYLMFAFLMTSDANFGRLPFERTCKLVTELAYPNRPSDIELRFCFRTALGREQCQVSE